MELGYYTDRLNHLDEREKELEGQLVTARLSLKSIKKEKEKLYNAMNHTDFESPFKKLDYEDKIKELTEKIDKMSETDKEKSVLIKHLQTQIKNQKSNKNIIKKLKKENKSLKGQIETLNMVIGKMESNMGINGER